MLEGEAKEDSKLLALSRADQLKKVVTVDNCFDLDYLNNVILEGLRYQGPGGISPVVFS